MADVASNLFSWSTTASSNSPSDATTIGAGLADNFQEIQKVVRQDLASKGADIASATTTDIGAVAGKQHDITGVTTITSFGTVAAGIEKVLQFDGALTLTHSGNLILPGAVNILTVAGDVGVFVSEGSGVWRCISFAGKNHSGTNGVFSGTLAVTGVATLTAQPILSSLTASLPVFSDASKGLVSNTMTGTGSVMMSDSPTTTGTLTAAAINASGIVTLQSSTNPNSRNLGTKNLIYNEGAAGNVGFEFKNLTSGNLQYITVESGDVMQFQAQAGQIFYYSGGKKFETTSGGASVTGTLGVSGALTITGNTSTSGSSISPSAGNTGSVGTATNYYSAGYFGTGGVTTDAIIARVATVALTGNQTISGTLGVTGAITGLNATAIPAGGTAGSGLLVSSTANFGVFFGSGAPSLSAAKGSLYLRSDGSATNNRMYVNTDGSTTWTAVTTAA